MWRQKKCVHLCWFCRIPRLSITEAQNKLWTGNILHTNRNVDQKRQPYNERYHHNISGWMASGD